MYALFHFLLVYTIAIVKLLKLHVIAKCEEAV